MSFFISYFSLFTNDCSLSFMIRVLIVDDSGFMRASLTYLLSADKAIQVAGTAEDGLEAIEKVRLLRPDVVLLDIEMPRMDGLTTLAYLMAEYPVPVVVLSGLADKDARIAIRALEHGAVDFIPKPSGVISYDIEKIKDEIISKVKIAAGIDVSRIALSLPAETYQRTWQKAEKQKELVVIGASTGGPRAVESVLSGLSRDISAAVLIVQHMRGEFIPYFAERLKWVCSLEVGLAQEGELITPGKVMVAPADCNTGFEEDMSDSRIKKIRLDRNLQPDNVAPSIDYTMKAAAEIYGAAALGVLLTGIGSDGAEGMLEIKKAGGSTIAEDEKTCIVYGMPKAAVELEAVEHVIPLPMIAAAIMRMV